MQSWIFCSITPVFSVTRFFVIILICWCTDRETFIIIINVADIGMFISVIFPNRQPTLINRLLTGKII